MPENEALSCEARPINYKVFHVLLALAIPTAPWMCRCRGNKDLFLISSYFLCFAVEITYQTASKLLIKETTLCTWCVPLAIYLCWRHWCEWRSIALRTHAHLFQPLHSPQACIERDKTQRQSQCHLQWWESISVHSPAVTSSSTLCATNHTTDYWG